jgi:hypothetical protein
MHHDAVALRVTGIGLALTGYSMWIGQWFHQFDGFDPPVRHCADPGVEGCYSNSELNAYSTWIGRARAEVRWVDGFWTKTEARTRWYVLTGYKWLWLAAVALAIGALVFRRAAWWPLAVLALGAAYLHKEVLQDLMAAGPPEFGHVLGGAEVGTVGYLVIAVGALLGGIRCVSRRAGDIEPRSTELPD